MGVDLLGVDFVRVDLAGLTLVYNPSTATPVIKTLSNSLYLCVIIHMKFPK